ncbi:MAG: PQQ-binding-like beta-propeller repeat protein [Pirellulaceae bacterium]
MFDTKTRVIQLTLLAIFAVGAPTACLGQATGEWSQFLGPNRNGVAASVELPNQLPPNGPTRLWSAAIGTGMSGIAVSGGSVYTLDQDENGQYAVALSLANGKEVWRQRIAAAYKNSQGDGPRSTPTVSGNQVLVFTGQGELVSLDAKIGKPLWQTDVVAQLGGTVSDYGMSCSPLVVGEVVVVHAGAPDAAVVGVSLDQGSIMWKTGSGPAGYSSPCLFQIGRQSQVVALIGNQVLGIDPTSGDRLWSYEFATDYNCNTANPVQVGDGVLISAGEDHGSAMLRISKGNSDFQVKPIWESFGVKSCLRSEWQTPIVIDGVIFGFDNVGGAGPVTHLVAVDATSGKQLWRESRFGKSNAILADGKLLMSSMTGDLVLGSVNRAGYTELGRANVAGKTRQAPVLVGTQVLLRDDQSILCLDLSK